MLVVTPAYVILAFASWSALAAPLSSSQRHNRDEPAQKRSLSSSILTGRQQQISNLGPGLESISFLPVDGSDQPTMDCDHKSKSKDHGHKNDHDADDGYKNDHDADNDHNNDHDADDGYKNDHDADDVHNGDHNTDRNNDDIYSNWTPPGVPIVARRRFHSPMRRDSKAPESIFERGDPLTTREPVTVDDIVGYYLTQRAASRKRALRFSRGAN